MAHPLMSGTTKGFQSFTHVKMTRDLALNPANVATWRDSLASTSDYSDKQ